MESIIYSPCTFSFYIILFSPSSGMLSKNENFCEKEIKIYYEKVHIFVIEKSV